MSGINDEGEESLGTGLDRQVDKLADLEEVIIGLKRDLPSLRKQCERFKTERASLQTEIASLRSERDTLRLEVSSSHDQTTYLTELSISGELEGQGRLNRKIWALEQKNQALLQDTEAREIRYGQELEKERGVSSGLRDRIGTLDEKRRKGARELEEAEGREKALRGELEALRASSTADIARLQAELEALRAVSTASKVPAQVVRSQDQPSQDRAKLAIISPRRALQKRPSNLTHPTPIQPQIPATPTKSQSRPSHPPSTKRKRATSLSPTSLAKRCTILEDRHALLKAEYDKLRSKYQDDIKHWKEWKAADTARREDKKKRKERRKTTATPAEGDEVEKGKGGAEEAGTVTLVPPSQEQESDGTQAPGASQGDSGSQRVTRSQAKKRKAEDEGGSSQTREPRGQALAKEVTVDIGGHADAFDTDLVPPIWPQETVPPFPPSQKRRITRNAPTPLPIPQAASRFRSETPTPQAQAYALVDKTPTIRPSVSENRKRLTPAARITPWLGASTKPISRTSSKPALADSDFDPFANDDDDSQVRTGAGPVGLVPGIKTPLVRDRGGGGTGTGGDGPASSLRRTLLARNMSTDVGDRIRSRERDSVSPGFSGGGMDSAKKRGLDMTGLSPAQIAQERKRLSRMTPAEKKAVYAEYKGKGRYIRPQEIQTRVTDEYEIDPKLNNGLKYQYHDVQRSRAERKLMHGGDCECCNGYYEAVGPLPKYNAGPAWRDPSPLETDPHDGDQMGMTEAQIKEHQNKVSRHRETWVRPPTPPGYWQIGFPNTQDVEEQNKKADAMVAEKEAKIRREAAHKDSKWKKKA